MNNASTSDTWFFHKPEETKKSVIFKSYDPLELVVITQDGKIIINGKETVSSLSAARAIIGMILRSDGLKDYRHAIREVLSCSLDKLPEYIGDEDDIIQDIVQLRLSQ